MPQRHQGEPWESCTSWGPLSDTLYHQDFLARTLPRLLWGTCEVAFSQVLVEGWQENPLPLPLPQLLDVLASSRQKSRVGNRDTDVHLLLSSCLSFFYILIVHVWISQVPQIGLLKTTEIYCLIVLEAQSQNQNVSRAMLPLKPLWETPSLPLLASGIGQ